MTTDPTQTAFEARYANLLDLTKAAGAWGCQTYAHSHVDAMWAGWKACAEANQAHSLPGDVGTILRDPSHMPWEALRDTLWQRFRDDERDDDDLCVSRAEACALLGWASNFDREAQPRRDDEEKSFSIIRNAAESLRPGDGEVIFSLRISGEHSSLQTVAGKGVEPQAVLSKAIETLEAERQDAVKCPVHRPSSGMREVLSEARATLIDHLHYMKKPESLPIIQKIDATLAALTPSALSGDAGEGRAPFACAYCGAPSWVDPSDQSPPLGYCHPDDHGAEP